MSNRLFSAALVAALFLSPTVSANFHLMRIHAVMPHAGGDARIQYVELRMNAAGQNVVGGHKLLFQDERGNQLGEFVIPSNVSGSANDSSILFGTQGFADNSTVAPDFLIPAGLLRPFGGRVCFEDIDCLAYGNYTGDNTGYGSPAAGGALTAVTSLTRVGNTNNNLADFTHQTPAPRNNAGQEGAVDVTAPPCYLTDNFDDLSNWDKLVQPGFDLNNCGIPAVLDIGTIEADSNTLRFLPSVVDEAQLGNPVCFTGMSNDAARQVIEATPDEMESYRVQFNILAEFGIVQGAAFLRQHYTFNDEDDTFDGITASGIGFNFTFGCGLENEPPNCPDSRSDHSHADVRTACIQEGSADRGPQGDALWTEMEEMLPDTLYTVVMDVDGDDINGPLTLQVKVFPADQPEPILPTTAWQSSIGIMGSPNAADDHLILIAALRSEGVDVGPALVISDYSVCEIPTYQKHVRFLECLRQADDSAFLSWDNPSDGDFIDTTISVLVNGELVAELDGDADSFIVPEIPDGDVVIEVVNYSGVARKCVLCRNEPPNVVIDGPEEASLEDAMAGIVLDSSASDDGNGNSAEGLTRTWNVVDGPGGANAVISDITAVAPVFTTDTEGEYVISLTIGDEGCEGDAIPLSGSGEHVIDIEDVSAGGFLRGDCNGDSGMDISDAIFNLNRLFGGGPPSACLEACDVNGDGQNDISDPVFVLNRLFGGGPQPAEPHPECGPDPEPGNSIGCDTTTC